MKVVVTDKQSLFLKLVITKQILEYIDQKRKQFYIELSTLASDPVLVTRRFRMLSQLDMYEAQILQKIHNFEFQNIGDFHDSRSLIFQEITKVTEKNA